MRVRARHVFWTAALVAIGWWMWDALRPVPVLVDVGRVRRGSLSMSVADDGQTRVREPYLVHAPVRGRLLRTELRAGDAVRADQTVIAEIEPLAPDLLDERARSEATAELARARAAVEQARAVVAQAEAESAWAESERRRIADLVENKVAASSELEAAERDARGRREALSAARSAVVVAERAADAAAARAADPEPPPAGAQRESDPTPSRRIVLRAPVDGVVLRIEERSARPIEVGAPILAIGDPRAIEVVADLLSQDAVKVRPGMRAWITDFGGESAEGRRMELEGKVRRVEPSGVTKVSALGVEEQRVDVIVDPEGDLAPWRALGDGYRIDLRIETWRGEDLLLVPAGALFGGITDQAVYVVDSAGVAHVRKVRIGRRNALDAEVLDGLAADERVILHPSALVADGASVATR